MNSKVFKIFSSSLSELQSNSESGTIEVIDKRLFVNTDDKLLELLQVQMEGKRRMSASEFFAGHSGISSTKLSI